MKYFRSAVVICFLSGMGNSLANESHLILGGIPSACFGFRVSDAGDINGDQVPDFMVTAYNSTVEESASGSRDFVELTQEQQLEFGGNLVYVFFGNSSGYPAEVNDETFGPEQGFIVRGNSRGERFGFAISSAGDINGDGSDDIVITAPLADPMGRENAGQVFVIFGRDLGLGEVEPFPAIIDVATMAASDGFTINGKSPGDTLGFSVDGGARLAGDDFDDIIIGAPGLAPTNPAAHDSGGVYVVHGRESFDAVYDLSVTAPDQISEILFPHPTGSEGSMRIGRGVAFIGDINNDAKEDFAIGAPGVDTSDFEDGGRVYVVFGSNDELPEDLVYSDAVASELGFVIEGDDNYSGLGYEIGRAGFFNEDVYEDFVISMPGKDGTEVDPIGTYNAGQVVVMFGQAQDYSDEIILSELKKHEGLIFQGSRPRAALGNAIGKSANINDDCYSDILLGSNTAGLGGEAYVILGTANPTRYDLVIGPPGDDVGGGSRFGRSLTGIEDITNDDIDDIIVGADGTNIDGVTRTGAVHILAGSYSADCPGDPNDPRDSITDQRSTHVRASIDSEIDMEITPIDFTLCRPDPCSSDTPLVFLPTELLFTPQ